MNKQNIFNGFKKCVIFSWFFSMLLFPVLFSTTKILKIDFISNFLLSISIYLYFVIFVIAVILGYVLFFKLFYFFKRKIFSKLKRILFYLIISILIFLFSFLLIYFSFKNANHIGITTYCGKEFDKVYEKVLEEKDFNYFLTENYKIKVKYAGDKSDPFNYACKSFDGNVWEFDCEKDVLASNPFLFIFHVFFGIAQIDNPAQKLLENPDFYYSFCKNINDQEILNNVNRGLFQQTENNSKTTIVGKSLKNIPKIEEHEFEQKKDLEPVVINNFYIKKNDCRSTNGENNDCELVEINEDGSEKIIVNNLKKDIVLIKNFVNQKSPVGNEIYSAVTLKGSYNKNVYLAIYFTEGEGSNLLLKYNTENNVAEEIISPFNITNTWERGPKLVDEPANCIILGFHKSLPILGVVKNNEVWAYNIETKNVNKHIINDAENCSYYDDALDTHWDEEDLAVWINDNKIELVE